MSFSQKCWKGRIEMYLVNIKGTDGAFLSMDFFAQGRKNEGYSIIGSSCRA